MPTIADYRNKFPSLRELDDTSLIARVAEVQGVPVEDVMAHMGYKPKARGMLSALNDTVIEFGNAAAGGVKAAADFVKPGNPVSEFIDQNIIRAGEANQSDVVKAEKARYRAEMEGAEGIGDEVGSTLGYVARNPLLSVAQAAGSFVAPGAAIKGAGMLSSVAGLGAKGAARAGLAGGAVAGAALSGGDAAGTAYELVKKAGGTDEEATEAARKASVLPAAIGAAGGVIGAERLFAGAGGFKGGMVSRALKTAGVEGAQEAVEEGVTQYEGQAAAAPYDPSIDPTKGVAGAAVMGGVLGGATGAGVSLLSGEPAQPKKPGVADVLAAPSVDDAINTAMQAVSAPAVKPRKANEAVAAELAMLDPADRAEALSLMQVAERQDVSGNVRRFARNRLDALLAPIRTIPTGEVTEMLPVPDARELTDEERAEYANAAPFSYRRAMERGLPQPEVTELVPAGDATELEPIPVGDASEPIPTAEAYETLPTGEADELIPTADATEFEAVPAGEASELDVETIQPGDLMAKDGEPFTSKTGAQAKAYASGGGKVVTVPNHFGAGQPGYVVRPLMPARPNNTRGTNADDVARPDGQRPTDAGRGDGVAGVPDQRPGDVLPSTAGAAGQGVAGTGAAGGGNGRANALSSNGFIPAPNGYKVRVSRHQRGSNALDPESDIGAFIYEVRKGDDDLNPLTMVVRKDGKLVPANTVLTDNKSNGTAWVPRSEENASKVADLLAERAKTAVGSPERAAVDAKIAETVTADQAGPTGGAAAPNTGVIPGGLRVTFGGKTYPVESVEDAQRKWEAFRDSADGGGPAGVSQVGNGIRVTDGAGRFVARISYNGRVWDTEDTGPMAAPSPAPAAPTAALTDARRDLRGAMDAIDRYNDEWNALYREGLPYFTGDGKDRKLSPNAPDGIKERYARLKKQKGTLQAAYDDASARVQSLTPAAAPRPAPAPAEAPAAPAPEAAKPRQLNGSDADKAAPLFQTEKQRNAPTLTEGQRVTLKGEPYTVVSATPSAVKLQGADGGTKMVARGSKTFQAIQQEPNEATRPQTQAAAGEGAAPAAAPAPAAPAVVPGATSGAVEADGVKREPWTMTREEAATEYPGDEYDRMLNRSSDLGDIPYAEADRRARVNAMGQRKLWAKTRAQLEQEGKDAVKAARGDRAAINKLKGTPEFANWRIRTMSANGKQAIADAERLARDYLAIHKDRVQEALMEGKDVPAEVLADYPDLKRPAPTPNAAAPASTQAPEPASGAPVAAAPAEAAPTAALTPKAQAVKEKLAATPKRTEARGKAKHPKTVAGSSVLAMVSESLGGLDPAWLGEFSSRQEINRIGKDGRRMVQWRNPLIPGVGRLFRKGGTQDLQQIAELLEEAGYLEPGSVEADASRAGQRAQDMVREALQGDEPLTWQGRVAKAQQEAADEALSEPDWLSEFDDSELDEKGYTESAPDVQQAIAALLAEAEALGLDTEAMVERAAMQAGDQPGNAYDEIIQRIAGEAIAGARRQAGGTDAGTAGAGNASGSTTAGSAGQEPAAQEGLKRPPVAEGDRIRFTGKDGTTIDGMAVQVLDTSGGNYRIKIRTDEPAPQGGGNISRTVYSQDGTFAPLDEPLLTAQTPEDLKAKTEREAAAVASERAKKAAEQERLRREAEQRDNRARADQTVDDFQLGQSADQQMSGMGDMFADAPAPAAAPAPQPVAEPDALPNPWEISQDEFVRRATFTKEGSTAFPWVAKWGDRILEAENEVFDHPDLGKTVVQGGRFSKTKREAETVARGAHKRAVRRGVLNGNTATDEALAAYPDLQPAPATVKESLPVAPAPQAAATPDAAAERRAPEAEPAKQAAAILDAAAEPPKGKERLDVLKDVKAGAITPDEVAAAYPAKGGDKLKYPLAPAGTRYEETDKPITMMTPDAFLAAVRPLEIDEASRDNIEDLKRHILSGKTLDPLHIRADGKEDGRHRAVAAKELGIKQVPVVDERATKDAAPMNTEDAGAELTYNRRNRIKAGIKWDDIASKNDALKVKEAVKQNVYPRPDYQALVDGGMQPLVAHLVKQAYDAIAAKPNTRGAPTDADLQTYIAGVNRVMAGVLAWANDPVSVSKWATREARSAGAMLGKSVNLSELAPGSGKSMLESVYPEGWKGNQAEVIVLGGNKLLGALQPSYDEAKRAGKAVDAGWPASQEAWEKRGIKVIHAEKIDVTYYEGKRSRTEQPYVSISYRVGQTRLMDQLIDGAESKDDPKVQAAVAAELDANQGMFIVMDKSRRIVGKQKTEEAAKDVARELTKREGKNGGPDDSGIEVAMARREGPPRRLDGENVSSDKLKEDFGLKGVNFGTWMKGDTPALRAERQAHLNHAYDSFSDLAELLGVPPKAMSLNGMLGLAIGAQGNGKYAAHFVPGVNEINLTRTSGAGSLAHEFGHALDHYFATQAGFAKREDPFLTEHTTSVNRKVVVENGRQRMVVDTDAQQIRPEIVERFKAIVQAMNKKPETVEQFNARQQRAKEIAKSNVSSWLKSIRRDYVAKGVDEAAIDAIATRILALDLGDGKIMVSPTLAVHPVVDELRGLYRKKAGRVPPIDQIKGLQSNLDYYAYAMSEKPGAVDHVPQQVSTDYANAAASLDKEKGGKRYWSTNLEKFARAFDAFVSDELEAKAAKNTYLSHAGRTGETVPMGDERKTINAAIKALVGEIQTREDDAGNVAMFSRTPGRSVELEAADAVGREFWRKIDNGESFTDQEVLDALSINRRGSRRVARGMATTADQAGTGTATVEWQGDLASFGVYTSRASWDGDNFNVFFVPDSLAQGADLNDDAQARDRALVHISFRLAGDGRYEISFNDPPEKSTAILAAQRAGVSFQAGTADNEYRGIDLLRNGDVRSNHVGQEAIRRLALNIGQTPAIFYPRRETGARAGQENTGRGRDKDYVRNRFSRTPGQPAGIPLADAEAVADAIRAAYPTGPQIVVVDDVAKAPESLLDQIRSAQAMNSVEGAYYKGRIYLFPQNVGSIERLMFVGAHHEIRHAGLDALFGKRKGALLLSIAMSNPKVAEAARKKMADGLADSMVAATEEALADMPLEDMAKLNGWNKIVAAVRQWLRGMADRLRRNHPKLAAMIQPDQWTDNDIAALIQRAEDISRGGTVPARSAGAVFSDQDSPDWYSALADQVGKASMNAGPASAWKALLKNWTTTGKVKADEVEWSGLNEWLDMTPGKITKAQVADYLRASGVQVQETVLGDAVDDTIQRMREERNTVEAQLDRLGFEMRDEYGEAILHKRVNGMDFLWEDGEFVDEDGDPLADTDAEARDLAIRYGMLTDQMEQADSAPTEASRAKYANYALPGGTNYREVLLTLPVKGAAKPTGEVKYDPAGDAKYPWAIIVNGKEVNRSSSEATAPDVLQEELERAEGIAEKRAGYKSGHWDQPNILAHIRVNDRTDADGARVLFVEEVQSDWAQEGKKKGFDTAASKAAKAALEREADALREESNQIQMTPYAQQSVEQGRRLNAIQVRLREIRETAPIPTKIPEAPFVGSTDKWVALAMKRVIKMAVDGGYDKVAFVTGEQSAERYDLSKQVRSISWINDPNRGDRIVTIKPEGGRDIDLRVANDGTVSGMNFRDGAGGDFGGKNLSDVIGKDLAEKVMAAKSGTLRGLDLKVGGEGMRAFYDKIVPAVTKDVLRKLGGGAMETVSLSHRNQKGYFETVGEVDENGVPVDENPQARFVPDADVQLPQPGFTITQQMRDKARGGMPLFSRADQTQTPAFRRWFGASKVVGADGKPLRVYHGTGEDFSVFKNGVERGGDPLYAQTGLYFAEDSGISDIYGDREGGNVMPVYLSIKNPLDLTDESAIQGWKGAIAKVIAPRLAAKVMREEALRSGLSQSLIMQSERDKLMAAGYDGIKGAGGVWIAFKPEQIKSATGNNGEYDPGNADIRFSIRAGTAKVTAQDLVNSTGGVFDFNRLGETKQDRLRTVMDAGRPGWLGLLTRDQIADVYGKEIPPVKDYDELTRAMENQRSKIAQDADELYSEWAKLPAETNDKLARLMLDATIYSVHPDGAFAKLNKPNDAERQQVHARLKAQYALMGKEAQAVYGKVRDFHKDMLTQLRDALEDRIKRQVENGQAKAAALTKIRTAFDAYLKEGPYFPLSRFGDFIVVGTRDADGERVVASYATAGEQAAAARTLEADGFTVKMKTAKTYSRETDGSAGKFIGDVLTTLNNLDMMDATVGGNVADLKTKLMDDVNQLFIKALPDLSYRRHFMHRKGTPGFSSDMMRGFASSAFHAASHIARLNHGDRMTFALQDAFTAIEQAPAGDFNLHSQVLNELTKRHDAALNPNTHPVAAMLNQVGFVMYLGLSPAAGLINMLQTVMVTMPHLSARYGFGKANGSLAKALSDITTGAKANAKNGWNAAQSTKLSAAERTMMSELQDEGVIDLTQAHDLSAATGLDTGNVARSKAAFAMARAMKIVGWTFHIPEVMNRQVTALSAYRLEMEKSGNEDAARDAAREAIKRTHFDYSQSNRARFMQGNVARVILQFKAYSQNMTYLLGRAAYQALKGESPEVRSIARRQLIATFGVTFGMAGALGLPGLGAVAGLIGMLVGAMDDDDEPYDWKAEFRNLMADTFGKEAGEVLSHGVPRALMPWDISNRVSLGDLWFRDSGREGQSPREAFATDAANILGPTAGTVLGLYTAADHMARGNWSKAAESVVPKFLRDPLKAIREGSEGVTSYNGEPLMDVTGAEVAGRLLGFAPARASEMYEGKAAVMNAKTAIEEKRQSLISRMAKARIDKDTDTAAELQPEIVAFNQRNPDFKITGATLAKAIMTRMRNRRNTEDGILLPRTKDSLREIGRFAEVD